MRSLRKPTALRTGLALILIAAGIVSVLNLWRAATERPPCTAPAATPFTDKITLEQMFGGMPIDKPVQLLQHPSRPDTWFVVLHRGVVERRRDNEVEIVLDISDRVGFGAQWGLQQIALHPNFPTDPRVFVTYIAHGDVSTVAVLHTRLDGNEVDTSSEVALFREAQQSPWHPVGGLRFGPDGYLYVAWGYGQLEGYDASQLRGNMLRINVDRNDNGKSYAIPADNPFIDTEYDPAVFATGLRNPWRFSFDDATGELWLGDVGEDGYEEINVISAGKDYGWPAWEGTACRRADICARQPGEPPLYQHTHAEMCSIIGGYFYRGRNLPALRDKYVYGDHCTGMIWALDTKSSPIKSEPIGHTDFFLSSLAEDRDGELYAIVTRDSDDSGKPSNHHGRVFKIVPATGDDRSKVQAPTQSLSELGCVVPSAAGTAAPGGMIEYALNHALGMTEPKCIAS
jgi:glucose/arabinose dehydrogenase